MAGRISIDTVPVPDRPVSLEIPVEYLREFEKDARIVVRHPWVIGIPIPFAVLKKIQGNPKIYQELTEKFEMMLVPK